MRHEARTSPALRGLASRVAPAPGSLAAPRRHLGSTSPIAPGNNDLRRFGEGRAPAQGRITHCVGHSHLSLVAASAPSPAAVFGFGASVCGGAVGVPAAGTCHVFAASGVGQGHRDPLQRGAAGLPVGRAWREGAGVRALPEGKRSARLPSSFGAHVPLLCLLTSQPPPWEVFGNTLSVCLSVRLGGLCESVWCVASGSGPAPLVFR